MTEKITETISDQIESILSSISLEREVSEKNIHKIDDTTIQIVDQVYRLVENYRDGFNFEAFENRYQEYYEKFDFIVGDWGYEQLRLRGFYQLNKRKVPREQQIDFLEDYLKEYCNFGCKYFVLAKEEALLKYNQMTLQEAPKKIKQPTRPIISTKSKSHSSQIKPQIEKEKIQKVIPKQKKASKDSFQIVRAKGNKDDNQVIKGSKQAKKIQSKKPFVIKQLDK